MNETEKLIEAKPENKVLVNELIQFIIEQSRTSNVNQKWMDTVWQYFSSYPLKFIIHERIQPLWSRILIENHGKDQKARLFLEMYHSFLNAYPNKKGQELYTKWLDSLR